MDKSLFCFFNVTLNHIFQLELCIFTIFTRYNIQQSTKEGRITFMLGSKMLQKLIGKVVGLIALALK
jgi:hypothetical protein